MGLKLFEMLATVQYRLKVEVVVSSKNSQGKP
jgi:hypothetical protein